MRKSPQQAVYDWTYKQAMKLADTYDHLPMQVENAAYPFIVVEGNVTAHSHTKSEVTGTISQTLNIWGDAAMRTMVSSIGNQLLKCAGTTFDAYGYRFSGIQWHHTINLMQDTSVPNSVFNRAQVTLIFEII